MSYKVIVDSCGEFTPEMKADGGFEHVALGIQIEDTQWTDDDSLKQEELLLKIAESTSCAKTSCPSPERYMAVSYTHLDVYKRQLMMFIRD